MNEELRNSIIILKRIRNQLQSANRGLLYIARQMDTAYKTPDKEDDVIDTKITMYCIIYYSLMWWGSFLEEYEEKFVVNAGEDAERAKSAKRNAKQYVECLREIFRDIREIRNKILAHPFRPGKKGDRSYLTDQEFDALHNRVLSYPSIQPYTQISNCVDLIVQVIEHEFGVVDESLFLDSSDGQIPAET
jgi:hypothetical protein